MFDSQTIDGGSRPLKAVPIAHLARDNHWTLDTPRSYLVPVLLWINSGQGRLWIDGQTSGFTAHNAIYIPANTPHACAPCVRCMGTVLFLGGLNALPDVQDVMHLRLNTVQEQAELNELVEGFRRCSSQDMPLSDEMLYHRAALISLWIAQKHMIEFGRGSQLKATQLLARAAGAATR